MNTPSSRDNLTRIDRSLSENFAGGGGGEGRSITGNSRGDKALALALLFFSRV